MEGNPRKLSDPLLPGFSLFNVAFGHQRSGDTWLPSRNGSHVTSEKLGMAERASMLSRPCPSVIFPLSILPIVYVFLPSNPNLILLSSLFVPLWALFFNLISYLSQTLRASFIQRSSYMSLSKFTPVKRILHPQC